MTDSHFTHTKPGSKIEAPADDASPRPALGEPETDLDPRPADDVSPRRALSAAARHQRQRAAIKSGLRIRAGAGKRLQNRRVAHLAAQVFAIVPWLQPSDEPAVRVWAEMEIVAVRIGADLVTNGHTNAAGEPRELLESYRKLRLAQLPYAKELGLTPASRAELGLTVGRTMNIAEEFAQLHRDGGPDGED